MLSIRVCSNFGFLFCELWKWAFNILTVNIDQKSRSCTEPLTNLCVTEAYSFLFKKLNSFIEREDTRISFQRSNFLIFNSLFVRARTSLDIIASSSDQQICNGNQRSHVLFLKLCVSWLQGHWGIEEKEIIKQYSDACLFLMHSLFLEILQILHFIFLIDGRWQIAIISIHALAS